MANLLQSGVAWLAGVQKEQAAVTVTIRRGATETTGVKATVGQSGAEESSDDGKFISLSSVDFLILPADYAFAGTASEPRDGDEIELESGTIYEARPFAGEPSWRLSDEYGVRYRIHTKLKSRT